MEQFWAKLKEFCDIPAPSGLEKEVRRKVIREIEGSGAEYRTDPNGNLIVFKKGKHSRADGKKVLVAAHMDEVGFMVTHISDEGYIHFDTIGGIDRRVISGRRLRFCKDGQIGVVSSKAIHMQKKDERGVCEPVSEMLVDIGCPDRESASKLVQIGDCMVFDTSFEEFGEDRKLIKSKALDDRFGCAVMVDLIRSDLEYDTYFAFDTCEEIGCDGAKEVCYEIQPDIAIVLESTTAGDIAGVPDEKCACKVFGGAVISHMDNGTIYDKELVALALETAKENGIPCQLKNIVAGGNDARSFQTGAAGARVLAISAPTRYIHSASSVAAKDDLLSVGMLVKHVLERIN